MRRDSADSTTLDNCRTPRSRDGVTAGGAERERASSAWRALARAAQRAQQDPPPVAHRVINLLQGAKHRRSALPHVPRAAALRAARRQELACAGQTRAGQNAPRSPRTATPGAAGRRTGPSAAGCSGPAPPAAPAGLAGASSLRPASGRTGRPCRRLSSCPAAARLRARVRARGRPAPQSRRARAPPRHAWPATARTGARLSRRRTPPQHGWRACRPAAATAGPPRRSLPTAAGRPPARARRTHCPSAASLAPCCTGCKIEAPLLAGVSAGNS